MTQKNLLFTSMLITLGSAVASAGSICPAGNGANPFPHNPDNAATGCNIVITINPGGSLSSSVKDGTPYETSEDVLVGVVNNSGGTVSSLQLTGNDIFGFDGDGICTFTFVGSGYCTPSQIAANDPQDYAGPTTTFPGFTFSSPNTGTVAFTGGLANGATTYFSLEGLPNSAGITGTATGGGGTTSVPTLGDAGLLLLAASLAGAAIWKMRRTTFQQ